MIVATSLAIAVGEYSFSSAPAGPVDLPQPRRSMASVGKSAFSEVGALGAVSLYHVEELPPQ